MKFEADNMVGTSYGPVEYQFAIKNPIVIFRYGKEIHMNLNKNTGQVCITECTYTNMDKIIRAILAVDEAIPMVSW